MKRGLTGSLLFVFGTALILPQIWSSTKTSLRPDDATVAFTPVYRSGLENLDSGTTFSVMIPNNEAWRRIRRVWTDPGYVIAPVSPDLRTIYCLDTWGIEVQPTVNGQPLLTQIADSPPYGFSASCSPIGVKFNATPGSRVEIRIYKRMRRVASPGDLLVTSYWKEGTKDRLVGIALDQELRIPFLLMAAVGILCLGGGGVFLLLAPASNRFPGAN